jgi:hypothetical protein
MNLTLNRRPSVGGATIGELLESGKFLAFTLEDEIREIPGVPVGNWKIKGVTAIPAGRYRVTMEHSPRFGPNTLTINAVPGFTGVRIHGGNRHEDSEGCPLLGLKVTASTIVGGTSGPAVKLVKDAVRQALAGGQQVWIDINNPTAVA